MINAIKVLLSMATVPLLVFSSIYLTIKLRAINLRKIKLACSLALGRHEKRGNLSAFGAFATVIGGNLGAGNIAGVAIGLKCGGPGSLFWLFIMCLISGVIKFAGSYLGVRFRKRGFSESGEHIGGPMIYLGRLGGKRLWPIVYVTFLIFSALTTGNLVQVNAVANTGQMLNIPPVFLGMLMMGLVAYTILGKTKRFSDIVTSVVPAMAITYVAVSAIVLIKLHERIIPSLWLIVESALSTKSFCEGVCSYSVWQAIRIGFDRGLMATDAGIGLESIVHASAESANPRLSNAMVQGLTSSISPLIVAITCLSTGLVMITTNVWTLDVNPTQMCILALSEILPPNMAVLLIFVLLYVFAFTTILTWAFCSTKGIELIVRKKIWGMRVWKSIFILTIPIGSFCNTQALWEFADIGMNAMLLLNLSGILLLLPFVVRNISKENISHD